MGSSIQDFLKKINSRLTVLDCVSLGVTAFLFLLFSLFVFAKEKENAHPVSYMEASSTLMYVESSAKPFGSKTGTTYTFSWCQGASLIKPANLVYFANEEEAKRGGRTLSKLCQR